MAQEFTFTVNGVERTTTQNKPLLRYLRDDLHIHSAKDGCSEGACGTCTIHVDGAAVKACVLTTALAAGRNIVTVEGLPEDVREAFVYAFGAVGAVQCGFCIPGMVMAGAALVAEDPEPTEEQIKYAIRGNVCRCTGYKKIIEGISLAAAVLRGEKQIDEGLERGDDYGVGKRAFRIDVRKKVLGEGKYPDDIDELDQPGLTYASAVRSKYPRARVLSIDTSKAEALPGQRLVRVAFGGTQTTDKPLVASLAIECGALVSIMAADTRIVNGQTLGSMLLALPDDDKAAAALEYIRNYPGITFEEVNG